MKLISAFASFAIALTLTAQQAHFGINEKVLLADPGRIGINLGHSSFYPWTRPTNNLYLRGAGLNGAIARIKLVVGGVPAQQQEGNRIGTGPDFLAQATGLGYFDSFRTGFWDGAHYIAYRFEKDAPAAVVLREGRIRRFINPGGTKATDSLLAERLEFDTSGPELRVGDEIVLTRTLHTPDPAWFRVAASAGIDWRGVILAPEGQFSYDLSNPPPIGDTDSSLRIVASETGFTLGQDYLGNQRESWIRLPEGRSFRFSAWMRHEGPHAATVELNVATIARTSFRIGPTWKEYTFDFPASHPQGNLQQLRLSSQDSGTFWIGGIVVHAADIPAGGFLPEAVKALKDLNPGVLRLWALQTNSAHGETLDNALVPPQSRRMHFVRNRGATNPDGADLPTELALAGEVGADPWIVVNVAFNPTEWRNLIEFLVGPANSPYGRIRAARGHPEPYTKVFNRIHLELGNEVWSTIFAPWNWNNEPVKAAQYARLMWESAKSSPWFDDSKFVFMGPDWAANITGRGSDSYGSRFSRHNPLNTYQIAAHYAGGFDGVNLEDTSQREVQILRRLFYVPQIMSTLTDRHAQAAATVRPGLRPASYEGGPGYALPGPGKVYTEEQEAIGKSLASAITTLDTYLYAQSMGYGPMAYFVFGNSGINWQSHRPDWTPHAPILALTLRNQHAGGDLLGVETLAVPTYDVPGAAVASGGHGAGSNRRGAAIEPKHDVPTILCYPFRSGTDLSVILISREPREKRTVKVDLPFTPKPDYTEVRLQHPDPWANNRDEVMLKEQVVPKRGSGRTLTVDLEPHSMVVVKLSAN